MALPYQTLLTTSSLPRLPAPHLLSVPLPPRCHRVLPLTGELWVDPYGWVQVLVIASHFSAYASRSPDCCIVPNFLTSVLITAVMHARTLLPETRSCVMCTVYPPPRNCPLLVLSSIVFLPQAHSLTEISPKWQCFFCIVIRYGTLTHTHRVSTVSTVQRTAASQVRA